VELRGFEPLTPCMPSMRQRFATPYTAYCPPTSTQVKGGAESWAVGRREAMCSAVSGKSLARTPCMAALWHERRRHRPAASTASKHTLGAVLSSDDFGSSVEPAARLYPFWQTGVDSRSALEASVLMWEDECVRWSDRKVGNFEGLGMVRRVRRPSGETISDDRHSSCAVGTEQASIRSATAM
jgi:hypothetical protein